MARENSKISVVMTTYNGAKFLRPQIESILNQTHQPSEFIVGDDQSTDQTGEILTEYAEKSPLKWHLNTRLMGVAANFRTHAALADPENYIAFADQDDVWHPEKLAVSLARMQEIEQPNLPAMVYSDLMIMTEKGALTGKSLWDIIGVNGYPHRLSTILFGGPVSGCTMLINPTLARYIETIPLNTTIIHDEWLSLCAFTFGNTAIVAPPTISYRQHTNNQTFSTSHEPPGRLKKRINELRKVIFGNDDLFARQFFVVRKFYETFSKDMNAEKRKIFEAFLCLENAGYWRKKWAFRKACR